VERIGIEGSILTHTPAGRDKVKLPSSIPNHVVGVQKGFGRFGTNPTYGVLKVLVRN